MELIINIIGILGFVLSVYLGVMEIRKYHLRVHTCDPRIIPANGTDACFWIDVIVANSSALPLAVTKAAIVVDDTEFETLPSSYRYSKSDTHGKVYFDFSIETSLPSHLPAYDAKRFVFSVPYIATLQDKLRNPSPNPIQIRVILYTSRSSVDLKLECQYFPRDSYLKYRAALERRTL